MPHTESTIEDILKTVQKRVVFFDLIISPFLNKTMTSHTDSEFSALVEWVLITAISTSITDRILCKYTVRRREIFLDQSCIWDRQSRKLLLINLIQSLSSRILHFSMFQISSQEKRISSQNLFPRIINPSCCMTRKDLNLEIILLSKLWKTLFWEDTTGRSWRNAFMQFGKLPHANCL